MNLYDKKSVKINNPLREILMLSPNLTYNYDIKIKSSSLKN